MGTDTHGPSGVETEAALRGAATRRGREGPGVRCRVLTMTIH